MRVAILAVVLVSLLTPVAHAAAFTCSPADVASWGNRVHVRCTTGAGPIVYFAVNASFAPLTQRFTDIALAALVNGKTVSIQYDPADTSGPSFGCQLSNCRPALAIVINK